MSNNNQMIAGGHRRKKVVTPPPATVYGVMTDAEINLALGSSISSVFRADYNAGYPPVMRWRPKYIVDASDTQNKSVLGFQIAEAPAGSARKYEGGELQLSPSKTALGRFDSWMKLVPGIGGTVQTMFAYQNPYTEPRREFDFEFIGRPPNATYPTGKLYKGRMDCAVHLPGADGTGSSHVKVQCDVPDEAFTNFQKWSIVFNVDRTEWFYNDRIMARYIAGVGFDPTPQEFKPTREDTGIAFLPGNTHINSQDSKWHVGNVKLFLQHWCSDQLQGWLGTLTFPADPKPLLVNKATITQYTATGIAFLAGDWFADTTGITIVNVPMTASGFIPTQLQYQIDGGIWTNLVGIGTGKRVFSIQPGASVKVRVRVYRADTLITAGIRGQYELLGNDSNTVIVEGTSNRIAEISVASGDRPATVPQAYHDMVAAEHMSPNMHPGMGPFTHVAVADGAWSNPAIWDTGTVPGAVAIVNVGARTVTYDRESDVLVKDIHVSGAGTLQWDTTKDTRLWVDTLMCHGTFIMGKPGAPIAESTTPGKPRAEIVFHSTQAPLATTRLGLMTMGKVRMLGATKSFALKSSTLNIPAGATSVTLTGVAGSGWRVGDDILFLGTGYAGTTATDPSYTGPTSFWGSFTGQNRQLQQDWGFMQSQDEVRTITAISGDIVTFGTALAFAHTGDTDTLPHGQIVTISPEVANLSRSIRFRSADANDSAIKPGANIADRTMRAHVMFMHDDDVDVRYVESRNMARTDVDPTLTPGSGGGPKASEFGASLADPNNVRGRYAFHTHNSGVFFGRKQVKMIGLVVRGENGPGLSAVPVPGWGITHHGSRAAIEQCVTYNVRGAGIVSELGNEIGQWINNISAWNRGDGFKVDWGSRAENISNHNGHAGVGFESQARQILQQDNRQTSSQIGWMFMQGTDDAITRVPDEHSLRLRDPIVSGGKTGIISGDHDIDNDTYGIEQSQIPDFNGNISFSSRWGFSVAHRQFTDRGESSPMISRGFHCLNTRTPFKLLNYSFYYSFYDFLWVGGATGGDLGVQAWQMMFTNFKVRDFGTGFFDHGLSINYQGHWIDGVFENVTTQFDNSSDPNANMIVSAFGGDPTTHPAYGVMGPWTITQQNLSSYTVIARTWDLLNSATDLPVPYPTYAPTEPAPGTPKPYFTLAPGADLSLSAGGTKGIEFEGFIVDNVGVRRWPDGYSMNLIKQGGGRLSPRRTEEMTGVEVVLRNGCFDDVGTWKSRLWFVDHDRLTGAYFMFNVDVTLTGFDAGFLAANTVDPMATKPDFPLKPEAIPNAAIVPDTTAPQFVGMDTTYTVNEQQPLSLTLRSNDGHAMYSVVGTDAAKFEVAGMTLRWAGDGSPTYAGSNSAGGDHIFRASIRASDLYGNITDLPITVTMQEAIAGTPAIIQSLNASGATVGWWDVAISRASNTDGTGTPANGDKVKYIADQGPSGRHLTQVDTAKAPVLGLGNGLSWIDFSGVEEMLNTVISLPQPMTYVIALKLFDTTNSGQAKIMSGNMANNSTQVNLLTQGAGNGFEFRLFAGAGLNRGKHTAGNTTVLVARFAGTNSLIRRDGVDLTPAANSGTNALDDFRLAGTGLVGHIYCAGIFNRVLTASEITDLETLCASRSGIVLV